MLLDHVRKMLAFAGLALLVMAAACGSDDADTTEPEPDAAAPAAQVGQPESCEDDIPMSTSKSYSAPPPMTIDPNKSYTATFCMEGGGQFTAELYAKEAPNTINSFVFLAREGFYNGVTFHRVLENFMAQGGDPTGTGYRRPRATGSTTKLSPLRRHDTPGTLSMANSGISNGKRDQRQPVLHHLHPNPVPRRLQCGRHGEGLLAEGGVVPHRVRPRHRGHGRRQRHLASGTRCPSNAPGRRHRDHHHRRERLTAPSEPRTS